MRPTLLAVAIGLLCAAAAPALAQTPGGERPRALLLFLPVDSSPRMHLVDHLARRGMSVGLASPTLGGYTRRQMALDVSQGTRVSARAYDEPRPPRLELELRGRGGTIGRWAEALERARDAPGDAQPGLLASALARAGRRVAYAGAPAPEQVEAIAAADRAGRIARVELTGEPELAPAVLALWRDHDLVVARLPHGREGLRALDRLLAARRGADLVAVVRAPPGQPLRLLPAGLAGPGLGGGTLRSQTTRTDGLVAATDLTATLLRHLTGELPGAVDGRPIERVAGGDPGELRALAERLDEVVPRRAPVVRASAAVLAALIAALALARGRAGLRTGLRLALLAALWMPALALATAALRPSGIVEIGLLALGAPALAALTDRLVRWPRGPAVPAAVVLVAHGLDLALGSRLVATSIAGPNPKGGARFFGVGNELEIVLAAALLVGVGAALAARAGPAAARALAGACLAAGAVVGAGRLGADVGGVITIGAGGAAGVLVLLSAAGRLTRRALVIAAAAPALAIAALVAIDLATGGGAHLTRSVIEADGPGDLVDVVRRRMRISLAGLGGRMVLDTGLAALLLLAGALRWRWALGPVRDVPGLRAGIVGAFAATVVGALANDSGPPMLIIGAAACALAVGYAHGRPCPVAPPASRGVGAPGGQEPLGGGADPPADGAEPASRA